MTVRPYFKKSIAEMEETFTSNQKDRHIQQDLLSELKFRNTQRALTLKKRVLTAYETVAAEDDASIRELRTQEKAQPTTNRAVSKQQQAAKIPQSERPVVKSHPKPLVTNDPEDILRTWTALEVLSPQGYRRETDLVAGEKSRIALLDDSELPWEKGEKSRPKKRLYYELILGAVALAPAVDALLEIYSDNRPDTPSMKGYSPVASIVLNKEGCPLEEDNSFVISSFAWGVPTVLQGSLKELANWPSKEKMLMAQFRERLIRRDRAGEILPLTKKHIDELFQYLVEILNLHKLEVKAPYFALRRYEYFASKTPPEPGLLNSFFLEDLSIARVHAQNGTLPHALRHYLGVNKPSHKTDLLADAEGLQHLLQPALTPYGRWPGSGRFPLSLLQQAAVNASALSMMETGILAVNGPPGTGKTTLLRDVVAARIVERAAVMCTYKHPADAFSPISQILQRSGAKITLHRLDAKLKGFEMIVASSNNKAVENVSAELPALNAIAGDAPNLRYFKTISDNVLGCETWGAITAVLGNASNRYLFSQSFWRDDENGLSTYLNHACGVPQVVIEPQTNGSPIRRNKAIVDNEQPPASVRDALGRWEKARTTFLRAVKYSQDSLEKRQVVHLQLVRLSRISTEMNCLQSELALLQREIGELKVTMEITHENLQTAEEEARETQRERDLQFSFRPGFIARIFQTRRFKEWRLKFRDAESRAKESTVNYLASQKRVDVIKTNLDAKQKLLEESIRKKDTMEVEKAQLQSQIELAYKELNASIPDEEFFSGSHEDIQKANLWFDKASSILRDDVFEAAIHLHRAFIDGAADPLRQNLSVFMESFGMRSLGSQNKDDLIGDLWATFFLAVPVISSTFASVHKMFSRLGPESLGWLLVDEAGQAVPQAAVGAILRTKRSVVVGDPLQIEPVVTLPNSLTEEICAFFGVDPFKYNAPEASVQTVADAASMYCARFPIGSGYRDVGAPLLVHRRCDSPMFEISNEIAYSNLMVQAKKSSPEGVLGPSSWIDVQGKSGTDKWCPDEAVVLIEMLRKLKDSGANADLYVVTPFVVVQDNLRQAIINSDVLEGWVSSPKAWAWEHVGTVHTVQGREASIVFFVLGAQISSRSGARSWAGGKPNLVNVAVTRAKTSLYVIGNRKLWRAVGVFSVLDRYLPNSIDVKAHAGPG